MSYETVTMGARDGEFLLSEASGERSREQVTLAITAVALPAGQLLGVVGGNYVPYDSGASDGSEDVAAILYASKPVSATTQPAAVVVRDAEVVGSLVVGLDSGATTALAALGIIVR